MILLLMFSTVNYHKGEPKLKKKRQETILALIEKYEIGTQDELMALLQKEGFPVTQATVSRDIKELQLIKSPTRGGMTKYMTHHQQMPNDHKDKFYTFFAQSAKSVDYAGNMCVIKCYEGTANAAGVAVDSMHFSTIVGSLAGDDTLFILCRNEAGAKELTNEIQAMINEV